MQSDKTIAPRGKNTKGLSMIKSGWFRWFADLVVVIMLGYAGWSFSEFTKLRESDFSLHYRLESMQQTQDGLITSIDAQTSALERQTDMIQNILIAVSYRTDPWSGKMMKQLQSIWFDILSPNYPDLKLQDLPDVDMIQTKFSAELQPPFVKFLNADE